MLKVKAVFPSFSVPDVDAARSFYGQTLGLEVKDGPMGNLELVLPGGGHATAYPKPDHKPATYTMLNLIVSDVDAAVDELAAAGVDMEHYDMPGLQTGPKGVARGRGPAIAWFKDPFGNILSIIEDTEGITS